ncbi:hypothetical protein BMF94_0425 [Rhodotorula taiwanensis]|uniref:HIT domain-containing protein n=1 Tax=Rhodotorula taiwanensis TaxID=741276 RepID=A0A2S5BHH9_9BASI|nr:hypothetical protein BMF94_0425 [Rhodotorula taiwanensis]
MLRHDCRTETALCEPGKSETRRLNPNRGTSSNPASCPSATASIPTPRHPEHTATKEKCIFCGITSQSEGFRVVREDSEVVIFHDRSPASRVHLLAVPKRHIDNVKTLQSEDTALIERMKENGQRVLREQGVPDSEQRLGFHIPPYVPEQIGSQENQAESWTVLLIQPRQLIQCSFLANLVHLRSSLSFYSVNHLHLHLLSLPLPFPGSFKYRPEIPASLERRPQRPSRDEASPPQARKKLKGFSWFVDVEQVLAILRAGERVRVGSVHGGSTTRSSDQQ